MKQYIKIYISKEKEEYDQEHAIYSYAQVIEINKMPARKTDGFEQKRFKVVPIDFVPNEIDFYMDRVWCTVIGTQKLVERKRKNNFEEEIIL